MENQSKGIVLLAIGHPNYVRMAQNLAVALNSFSVKYPITLITNEEVINALKKDFYQDQFTNIVFIDTKDYDFGRKKYWGRAKLNIFKYTPYDRTIFLDADSFPSFNFQIDNIFESTKGYDFYVSNYSIGSIHDQNLSMGHWATISSFEASMFIKNTIPTDIQSSLQVFSQNDKVRAFFNKAIWYHDYIKNNNIKFNTRWFNVVPDELCLSLAFASVEMDVPEDKGLLHSIYSHLKIGERETLTNCGKMITFATGVNRLGRSAKELYNAFARDYGRKANKWPMYSWIDKSSFIPFNMIKKK